MSAAANAAADGGRSVPSGTQAAVALLIGGALETPEFAALLAARGIDVGEIADQLGALPVIPEADPELERRRYRAWLISVPASEIADCLDLLGALISSPYIDEAARSYLADAGIHALLAPKNTDAPVDLEGARAPHGPDAMIGRDALIHRAVTAIRDGVDVALIGPRGVGKESMAALISRRAGLRPALIDLREWVTLAPAARSARLTAITRALHPGGVLIVDGADHAKLTLGLPPAIPLILITEQTIRLDCHPARRAPRRIQVPPLSPVRAVTAISEWAQTAGLELDEATARLIVEVATGLPGALPGSAIGLLRSAIEIVGSSEAIDRGAIEIAAAERGGLPLAIVSPAERARVRGFETALAARVVGQPEAVAAVGAAYRRRAIDIDLRSGPMAFLFSGPTGVGKTEMAKAIAEASFGDSQAILRLDMGEFQHDHEIARLVGAPQGYVGYGDPGQLTSFLKERPRAVLLFDEIEKGHPAMVRLLIGLIDTGIIHSGKGEPVSAKETTVILTSNIGGSGGRPTAGIGFGERPETTNRARAASVTRAVDGYFPPEFRNRLDAVIPFRAIDETAMTAIFELRVARLRERIGRWQVTIEIDPLLARTIVDEAIASGFGGRELARRFDALIADQVSAAFIDGAYRAGAHYRIEPLPDGGTRLVDLPVRRRTSRLA